MIGTAYVSYLWGRRTESESVVFGTKQKDKLNSRRDRDDLFSPSLLRFALVSR